MGAYWVSPRGEVPRGEVPDDSPRERTRCHAIRQGSIDAYRAQLEVEMAGAKAASIRQAALSAEVQQATRDLEGFLERGRELSSRIRTGIRSKYGNRNEKLTEFGMKVQRKRKAAVKVLKVNPPPQGVEKPAPQEVTPTDPKE
jgi:hypothetical protein